MKCSALLLAAAASVQAFQPLQLPQQRQQASALSMSYLDDISGSTPAPAKSYAPSGAAPAAGGAKGGTVPDDAKLFGHVAVAPVASSYVAPTAQLSDDNPTCLDDSKPYSCYSEYDTMDANSNNPYVGNRVSGDPHAY